MHYFSPFSLDRFIYMCYIQIGFIFYFFNRPFCATTLAGFLFSNNSSLNSLYCSLIFLSIYAIAAKLQSITSLSNFGFPQITIGFIIITSHYNFMYSFAFRPFGFSITLFVVYLRAKSLIDYLFHQLFCLFAKMFCYI